MTKASLLAMRFCNSSSDKVPNKTVKTSSPQVIGAPLAVQAPDIPVMAATIFNYYPAEPYKGKGVHIVGKFVRRKEGKKSA